MTCPDCLPLKIENEQLKREIETLKTPPMPVPTPMQTGASRSVGYRGTWENPARWPEVQVEDERR